MDLWGTVKAYSGFANDVERLQRFENLTILTVFVAVINAMKHNNMESKEMETKKEMNQIIETTIKLLLKWKGSLLKKTITKKQMPAILFVKYDIFVDVKQVKRDALVTQLRKLTNRAVHSRCQFDCLDCCYRSRTTLIRL